MLICFFDILKLLKDRNTEMCIVKNKFLYKFLKRYLDISLSLILIIFFIPLILITAILIKIDTKGPVLYWAKRVGQNNKIFLMPKFRTMKVGTPVIGSIELKNPSFYVTRIGNVLRKISFDEIPQLYSVLIGDMSLVGPRPALFNELDLIGLREIKSINSLKPGLTGYAQINGRDKISKQFKVSLDYEYLKKANFCFDLIILFITIFRLKWIKDISH